MQRNDIPWNIKREIVEKSYAETDREFGKKPEERTYPEILRFGIINLDKPSGPSSHEVSAWTKRIIGVKQAGHGGTLEDLV